MIKVRGARRRAPKVQLPLEGRGRIISREFFFKSAIFFAFWVQIHLEFHKNTMTITQIILYIYKFLVNDQAGVEKGSIFLRDLYSSVLSKLTTHNVPNSLKIP